MKKILAILLALMTLGSVAAFAESTDAPDSIAPNAPMVDHISGLIMEITDDGDLLIDSDVHGEVLVHQSEELVLNGVEELAVGQYIYITFNGVMTMSLPGQITADIIDCYVLTGEVLSQAGHNIELQTENGNFCLVLSEDIDAAFAAGEEITAYAALTDITFAGLQVANTEFVETIAPDIARD